MGYYEITARMNRLYNDLAWLWPIWEAPEEYREESELFASLIREHARIEVRSLLDIGCGGGKNAFHLKRYFDVTGIDISEPMLSHARELNPDCNFLVGDMRGFDLGRRFDAVFMNDSISYMISREDLLKAFRNANDHLKPGGVMLTYAERCKETFKQNQTAIWTSKTDDLEVTFIENNYDPDPKDEHLETAFVFLIREKGRLRIEHDLHLAGIFSLDTWRRTLRDAGFEVSERGERIGDHEIVVFMGLKP